MTTKEKAIKYKNSYPNATYVEIANHLNVSASTVREYLNPEVEKKKLNSKRLRIYEKKCILVDEFGGKCMSCGYNRFKTLLQFHHRDPSQKKHKVTDMDWSIETMREEAKKCDLLCPTCHGEAHIMEKTEGKKLAESRLA